MMSELVAGLIYWIRREVQRHFTIVVRRPCCRRDSVRETSAHTSGSASSRELLEWLNARRSCRTCCNETVARLEKENCSLHRDAEAKARLTRVNTTVILHVVTQFKGLSAELAFEWSVAGVHRKVRDERRHIREALSTKLTQHYSASVARVGVARRVTRAGIAERILHVHRRVLQRLH